MKARSLFHDFIDWLVLNVTTLHIVNSHKYYHNINTYTPFTSQYHFRRHCHQLGPIFGRLQSIPGLLLFCFETLYLSYNKQRVNSCEHEGWHVTNIRISIKQYFNNIMTNNILVGSMLPEYHCPNRCFGIRAPGNVTGGK